MEAADVARARAHRSQLTSVTFVGVTGSCGKTTTKDLATGLAGAALRGTGNPGSGNCGADVVRHLMTVEPSHEFCIQELGAWGPGTLDAGLDLVQPRVGVVLNVRRDHYSGFRGLEHTTTEKAKLVACLPRDGTAILNADDPNVAGMRERTRARVVTFGRHADADFRIEEVRSAWPERLSFHLHCGGERREVRTQLIGEHLVGSAVAAIAIARTLGVPIEDSIGRIPDLPPTARRMSSLVTETDVTVVRDDFKATSDSLDEVLRFLRAAHAARKVMVVGQISDYPGRSRVVYSSFARAAADVADLLIFVGERAEALWGGSRRRRPDFLRDLSGQRARVELFETVREASRFLQTELRAGDLLLLKGSGPADHLERVVLAPQTTVRCWRAHCGLVVSCDSCERIDHPAGPEDALDDTRSA